MQRAGRVLGGVRAVRLRVLAHDAARQGAGGWRAGDLRVQVSEKECGNGPELAELFNDEAEETMMKWFIAILATTTSTAAS